MKNDKDARRRSRLGDWKSRLETGRNAVIADYVVVAASVSSQTECVCVSSVCLSDSLYRYWECDGVFHLKTCRMFFVSLVVCMTSVHVCM